jgi:hypothetical protein
VNYNTGPATVTLTDFHFTADYNQNGVVDAADYTLWRNDPASYGGPGGYATWRANFGLTNLPGAGSGAGDLDGLAVPEPSTFALMVSGVVTFATRYRRTALTR